jgi:hypothetical protein
MCRDDADACVGGGLRHWRRETAVEARTCDRVAVLEEVRRRHPELEECWTSRGLDDGRFPQESLCRKSLQLAWHTKINDQLLTGGKRTFETSSNFAVGLSPSTNTRTLSRTRCPSHRHAADNVRGSPRRRCASHHFRRPLPHPPFRARVPSCPFPPKASEQERAEFGKRAFIEAERRGFVTAAVSLLRRAVSITHRPTRALLPIRFTGESKGERPRSPVSPLGLPRDYPPYRALALRLRTTPETVLLSAHATCSSSFSRVRLWQ